MTGAWDLEVARAAYPALQSEPELAYLDHAATSPRLSVALERAHAVEAALLGSPGRGVHRGVLGARTVLATARQQVADRLGTHSAQVVFTAGATAALNQAAHGLAPLLAEGDRVLVTPLDHHASRVPWQQVARRAGATLAEVPVTADLHLDLDALRALLAPPTRVLALPHVSNVVGRRLQVAVACAAARAAGVWTVVDGAQGIATFDGSLSDLGCDLYAFGGHKLGAVAGAGVLWGRPEALDRLAPWQTGGGMVARVGIDSAEWAPGPRRLESGTPPLGAIASLATALGWHRDHAGPALRDHLEALRDHLVAGLAARPWVSLACATPDLPTVAFSMHDVHPHDVGTVLDADGVAVRVGHHCAQPLHTHLGWSASVRASCGPATRRIDVDRLLEGLDRVRALFSPPDSAESSACPEAR